MSCAGCATCIERERCKRSSTIERTAKWGGLTLSLTGSLLLAASGAWTVAGIAMRDRALVTSSLIGMAFNLSATLIRL